MVRDVHGCVVTWLIRNWLHTHESQELDAVDLVAETNYDAADVVALIELLTSAMVSHCQHWSSCVGLFFMASTHLPPFAFASSSHIGLMPDLQRRKFEL